MKHIKPSNKEKVVKSAKKKGEHNQARKVRASNLKKTKSASKKPITTKQFRTLLKGALAGMKKPEKKSLWDKLNPFSKKK